MGKKTTVEMAAELATGLLTEMGLTLWDVTFAKEGSVWILRYLVDKEGGIDINACEEFSRSIDKLLDEADPIDKSYTLEVSSPGVERELTQDWHYEHCKGELIHVRLIRPVEGVRDFVGVLTGYDGTTITMELDDETEMELSRSEAAFVRLYFEF
ncbi:MAG: ribosome maturation factor RimP [Angelakisella sp.]